MKTAVCKLKSTSPYSQSHNYEREFPKNPKELSAAYEIRTWRERMHYNRETGQIFIPMASFAISLREAAKYANIQIPGKGKSTFTKNFESGIMVLENVSIDYYKDQVRGEDVYVPSNGIRGGSKRVWKIFAVIPNWEGTITYHILDNIITEDIFTEVLKTSGNLIGIGRFRPRNCGWYGRFEVIEIEWKE